MKILDAIIKFIINLIKSFFEPSVSAKMMQEDFSLLMDFKHGIFKHRYKNYYFWKNKELR